MERILKATLIVAGIGVEESSGVNVKTPGIFVEVLKDRKILIELDYCR